MPSQRTMKLVAFLQAQNCSNYPASWRHPQTQDAYLTPDYYQHIARVLEAGKIHLAFFDDRLAMPDRFGDDFGAAVEFGIRPVKLDLVPLMTAIGLATRRLGIGGTYSTTYFEPYHVARLFATLDHFTAGRAAWNVVTSLNDSEAANFGQSGHLAHDARYDRADEFMEVVLGLWRSWDEGAIAPDRATGRFADPRLVRRLDHAGAWFRSRGPLTVPRTPQGRPVLIQAGQSGRGRRFAARWAELVFVITQDLAIATRTYKAFKDDVAAEGRDPDNVLVLPAVYVIAAPTRAAAEEHAALIDALARPIDTLVLLSEALNFDFSTKAMDEPFTDDELASISGLQNLRDHVLRASGNPHPTLRDFIQHSNRGTIREFPRFVGSPADIADQMEPWFHGNACDGFVICATHMPGAYEDLTNLVVPELQRRGLFQSDYAGATLRENLGLPELE